MIILIIHLIFVSFVIHANHLEAAVKGDLSRLIRYLDEDPKLLNMVDTETGRTAVLEGCINDHYDIVEALVNLGADVIHPTELKKGFSCFDAAVNNGNAKMAKLLINKINANEECPKDGLRPIHRAAQGTTSGHLEILKLLLATKNVSANDWSREHTTPVGYVLRRLLGSRVRKPEKDPQILAAKRDTIRLLLENGADAKELDDDTVVALGLSFREVADYQKRPPTKRIIPSLRGGDLVTPDKRLLEAIQRHDWEWAEYEVAQNKANINTKSSNGQTPFMTACLQGEISMVKQLIKLGADPTIPESSGYTPFHGAGFQGHAEVAKVLLEELKLDPNDMHKDGFRPIHRACWGKLPRHADFIKYLLSTGKVDVDSPTAKGLSPLQVVASSDSYKNPDVAKILVQFGADVSVLSEQDIEKLKLVSADDFATCPKL